MLVPVRLVRWVVPALQADLIFPLSISYHSFVYENADIVGHRLTSSLTHSPYYDVINIPIPLQDHSCCIVHFVVCTMSITTRSIRALQRNQACWYSSANRAPATGLYAQRMGLYACSTYSTCCPLDAAPTYSWYSASERALACGSPTHCLFSHSWK